MRQRTERVAARPPVQPAQLMGQRPRRGGVAHVRERVTQGGGVRHDAAQSLSVIGPDAKAAVPALAQAIADDDTEVRKMAIYALGDVTDRPLQLLAHHLAQRTQAGSPGLLPGGEAGAEAGAEAAAGAGAAAGAHVDRGEARSAAQ